MDQDNLKRMCELLRGKICKNSCPVDPNKSICCKWCKVKDCPKRCKEFLRENQGKPMIYAPKTR